MTRNIISTLAVLSIFRPAVAMAIDEAPPPEEPAAQDAPCDPLALLSELDKRFKRYNLKEPHADADDDGIENILEAELVCHGEPFSPIVDDSVDGQVVLDGVDLSYADLSTVRFAQAILTGANLTTANLERTDLRQADLSSANLWGANLADAWLDHADLTGAIVIGADCTDARLHRGKLSGALLAYADLTGADLTNADLTGADLGFADLTAANLAGADLTDADLTGVVCPDGMPEQGDNCGF